MFLREDLFKEGPEGIRLLAFKCTACGKVSFPKSDFCTYCLNEKIEAIELSGKGTLYSYTTLNVATSKFKPPHAIGWIDTPEGARILSPLAIDERGFKIGAKMEMKIETLWTEDDKEILGYRFYQI